MTPRHPLARKAVQPPDGPLQPASAADVRRRIEATKREQCFTFLAT